MTKRWHAVGSLPEATIDLANPTREYLAGTAVIGEVRLEPPPGDTSTIGRVWLELSCVCAGAKSPTQRELVTRVQLIDSATVFETTRWPFELQLRYFPVSWTGRPFSVTWELTLHTLVDGTGRQLATEILDIGPARLPDAPRRASMPPRSAYRETARSVSRILSGERSREALHDHLLGTGPQTEIVMRRDAWAARSKRPEASDFGTQKLGPVIVSELHGAWLGLVDDHLELWCLLENRSRRTIEVDAIEWTVECRAINRFTRRGSVVFAREGALNVDGMTLGETERQRIRFAVSLPADVPGTLHKRYYEVEWKASVTVLTEHPAYKEAELFVLPLRPPAH